MRALAGLTVSLCLCMAAEAAALAFDFALPPPLAGVERVSVEVVDRAGVLLRPMPVEGGRWRLRARLERLDPVFVARLKAMEDARFDVHWGLDPAAILRAGLSDVAAGRVRSGGSTLTMQLARRLQPRPRTLTVKLIEAARALQLETRLGKRGVLSAYLTLAPYGGNLEGVRAASLAWFGHEPARLDDAEQALLIALPQSPEARRPDRHPQAALRARERVLARLQARGLITPAAHALASSEPLPVRQALPGDAWQVSQRLARAGAPGGPRVASTLDAALQRRVQALASQFAAGQGPASSVGVLVIEARSGAVRAAVGSGGLRRPGGWLDATAALRSPGSALKPFIYAMAFEGGLAAVKTRLHDAPAVYGAYTPRNFDRSFQGEVTADEALQTSLNMPAVALLAAVGPSAFERRLRAAGATLVRPRARLAGPSLALALGGEGVRLRDVALLYTALANGGVAMPLAWTGAEESAALRRPGVRLVSADAAEKVVEILKRGPQLPGRPADAAPIAFKTGTSYGYRDALAAGVSRGYVVAVWTGRPDGGSRPGLTGREAAAPLLFDIFDLLASHGPATPAAAPVEATGPVPDALQHLARADPVPRLLFPPDRAQIQVQGFGAGGQGVALTALGRGLRWYVDGAPVPTDPITGQTLWRPDGPGFFRLEAVDDAGRRALGRVRVLP